MTISLDDMQQNAGKTAQFLTGLASPHRLMILCQLSAGEKSVTELIAATGMAQTSMSQHLSKLKAEEIVAYRRDHRTLYYSITHPAVERIMVVLHDEFCNNAD